MQVLNRLLALEDKAAGEILPGIMAAVVQALQKHKHACNLDVISSAIEAFHRNAAQQQVIQEAFTQACLAVAPLLQVRCTCCASATVSAAQYSCEGWLTDWYLCSQLQNIHGWLLCNMSVHCSTLATLLP